MKRGEIWTVSGGGDYTGKPRPAVIVQADDITDLDSITICSLTTTETAPSVVRVTVEPSDDNGLRAKSQIMFDKVTTVQRVRLGTRVGQLNSDQTSRLDTALTLFLGLDIQFSSD